MTTLSLKKILASVIVTAMTMAIIPSAIARAASLDKPTNIELAGTTVSWDAVEGATGYSVSLYQNDVEKATKNTAENSYDFFSELNYLGSGTYKFYVTAYKGTDHSETTISQSIFWGNGEQTVITSMSATIEAPAAGATPSMTVVPGDSNKYTAKVVENSSGICWFKGGDKYAPGERMTADQTFEAGKTYVVEIEYAAVSGCIINDTVVQPTLNGQTGYRTFSNSYTGAIGYRYDFTIPETLPDGYAAELNDLDIGSAVEWYNKYDYSKTMTMKLTGSEGLSAGVYDMKIELTGEDADAFTVNFNNGGVMGTTGATYNIAYVKPVAGLMAGTYTATATLYYDIDGSGTDHDWAVLDTATITFTVTSASTEYSVTVVDGTPDKSTAAEGEVIHLTYDEKPGKVFSGWEVVSGSVTVQSNGTFTMPDGPVTVKANYVDKVVSASVDDIDLGTADEGYDYSSYGKTIYLNNTGTAPLSGTSDTMKYELTDGNVSAFSINDSSCGMMNPGGPFDKGSIYPASGLSAGTYTATMTLYYDEDGAGTAYDWVVLDTAKITFKVNGEVITDHTVTFNSNGGSTVASQTVVDGSKATKPSDPTKSGYTFGGWYTNSACTTAYSFDTAVTADITLYAKWTTVSSSSGSGSGSGSSTTTPAPTTPAPSTPATTDPAAEVIETPKLTTGIAHVQDIGDVSVVADSSGMLTIGTTGMGKRLEQITINFENNTPYSGTLEYRVHVQDIGWMDWVEAGEACGTEGLSKRIEAIEIRLTGELADYYSVQYCVHIQDYGDMQGWVKDGALAGTTGESKRIEELKIKIVPANSGSSMSVKYRVHVQDYGWEKSYASNGSMAGTSGESKRLEGIEIFLDGTQYSGGIKFKTHVQDYGWQGWSYDGEMSGTQGEAKRLEGICIELYGEIAEYYDIYYRVHAQDIGWMAWAKNGECAGTAGRSARLEGIQIVLVPKGDPAPGATYEGITAVTEKAFVEGF